MGLYIGSSKYTIAKVNYRGFWSVTVKGLNGTVITCGTSKTIDEHGFVIFKFVEPGTYTFTATKDGETKTESVVLSDTTGVYYHTIYMYILTDYNVLQYIESTGTQYINTQETQLDRDEFGFVYSQTVLDDEYRSMIGAASDSQTNKFYLSQSSSGTWVGNAPSYGFPRDYLQHTLSWVVKLNLAQSIILDSTNYDFSVSITPSVLPVYLFTRNAGDSKMIGKIYSYYHKRNGVNIRDFIPVQRISDSEVGMFDLANGVFYGNAGTGSFTPGPIA